MKATIGYNFDKYVSLEEDFVEEIFALSDNKEFWGSVEHEMLEGYVGEEVYEINRTLY